LRRGPRRAATVAAIALGVSCSGLTAPGAGAAGFQRCGPNDPGSGCARLSVALDHTGAVPGRISLLIRTRTRKDVSRPRRGVLITLAGGPGQAGSPLVDDFATTYAPALRTRDLVVPDQRGTGGSGLLRCPGLEQAIERLKPLASLKQAPLCAASLGDRRRFFTTPDSVADLESIRQALGVQKLAIAGVSYGTKVALAYAEAYPTHVEFLILDSVVKPDGPDPFERSNLNAEPGVLRSICKAGACGDFTRDPVADLVKVLARIRAVAVRGVFYTAHGHAQRVTLTPSSLLDALYDGDLDPLQRARIPAALKAFLDGDHAPIFRLLGASRSDSSFDDPADLSTALYFATSCEDTIYPWTRSAPAGQRIAEIKAAAAAIPDSEFAPFTRADELSSDEFSLCARWPLAPTPRYVPAGPLPDVPALVFSGREDLRTPLSDARAVAAAFPRGQLVIAQHSGHSVATSEGADCATAALREFLAGKRASPCKPVRIVPVEDVPPRTVPDVSKTGYGARIDRTLAAFGYTFFEALDESIEADGPTGGLRGGFLTLQGEKLILDRYSVLPGYGVSAVIGAKGAVRVTMTGARAARGFIVIPAHGPATGRLGGRRISIGLKDISQTGALRLARPGLARAAVARAAAAHAARRIGLGPRIR
jgi:pimeloyl-ACP methyl ester carboxylesterase